MTDSGARPYIMVKTNVSGSCAHARELWAKVPSLQRKVDERMASVQDRLSIRASKLESLVGDAVMVDVRDLGRNVLVLENFRTMLPLDWDVHFWHGPTNFRAVQNAPVLALAIAAGNLRLRRLIFQGVPATRETFTLSHYQSLLTSVEFWQSFSRKHLLLFESDSVLCPSPSVPLSAFGNTSFVGAPWTQGKELRWAELERAHPPPQWCFNLANCVGNSGFSLWRRDVVYPLLSEYPRTDIENAVLDYLEQPGCIKHKSKCYKPRRGDHWGGTGTESNRHALYGRNAGSLTGRIDVWMTRTLQAVHAGHLVHRSPGTAVRAHHLLAEGILHAVPAVDEASMFSVETSYSGSYTPIGVHKAWRHLSVKRFDQLVERCAPVGALYLQAIRDTNLSGSGREAAGLARSRSARDDPKNILTRCAPNASKKNPAILTQLTTE